MNYTKWDIDKVRNHVSLIGGELISTEYIEARARLTFKCPDCGEVFERVWFKIVQGQSIRCKKCAKVHAMKPLRKDKHRTCERCGAAKAYKKNTKLCRECWKDTCGGINHPNYGNPNNRNIAENNPAWTGGAIPYWRKQVISVGKCDCCGYAGVALVAHHLDSKSSTPEKKTEVSNGICVCANCHMEFHLAHGNECVEAQYTEFKELKESTYAAM